MDRILGRREAPNEWWVAIVCGLAALVDAAASAGVGTALVLAQSHGGPGLSPNEIGLLTGVLTGSVAIGALVGGRLADRFGRRPIFMLTMVMVVLGAITPLFGISFGVLLPGILLVGLGVGADLPTAMATTSEAASDRNRGKLITLSYILSTFGVVMAIIISILFGTLGTTGAKIMFGSFGIVGLIVLLLRLTIPESRVWLAARAEQKAAGVRVRAEAVRLRSFFEPPYRRPFLVLIVFYGLSSMAIGVSASFGTYVAVNVARIPIPEYQTWTLAALPAAVLGGVGFSAVVDTRFRMLSFVLGAIVNVLAPLIPVAFGFNLTTLIASTIIGVFAGGFCFEAAMKVWTQESFPTMLRSTAQGTIYAVGRFAAAGIAVVTPSLLALSAGWVYFGVAAAAAIGYAVAWWGFRRHVANQFDVEAHLLEDAPLFSAGPAVVAPQQA